MTDEQITICTIQDSAGIRFDIVKLMYSDGDIYYAIMTDLKIFEPDDVGTLAIFSENINEIMELTNKIIKNKDGNTDFTKLILRNLAVLFGIIKSDKNFSWDLGIPQEAGANKAPQSGIFDNSAYNFLAFDSCSMTISRIIIPLRTANK